ncbi:MAG TPA: tRNA pseudouridine(55) synthase TruB [Clostridiales bacterium]|nr:tRNA pseudouridine(55) synthase TruB [Clostridiales bacterium]
MMFDGVLNVLKPPGMTSFDVVAWVRRQMEGIRTGHTGTLDPSAAGVLPICTGKATRAADLLSASDKCYRAEMTLGITTDTLDGDGRILSTMTPDVSEESIRHVLAGMEGPQMQVPPMYSAVQTGGVRLYELARKGQEVERSPRLIVIYSLKLLSVRGPKVMFDVECSKGTYVRKLCADLGDRLGCGAYMSFLLRLRTGVFRLEDACTLETVSSLKAEGRLAEAVMPLKEALSGHRGVVLAEEQAAYFTSGGPVTLRPDDQGKCGDIRTIKNGDLLLIYGPRGELLGFTKDLTDAGNGRMIIRKRKIFA